MSKVVFIGNASSIHIRMWAEFFEEDGHEIFLITSDRKNVTNIKSTITLGSKTSNPSGNNYHYLLLIKELRERIIEISPDHVIAHYSYSMGLISYLALRKIKKKITFSIVCHGSDILSPPRPKWLFSCVNRVVLKKSDKIFAVSNQIYDKIISWNIESEKIFVGQYGVRKPLVQESNRNIDIISNRAFKENSQINEMLKALNSDFFNNMKIVFILPEISNEEMAILENTYPNVEFIRQVEHVEMINLLNRTKIYISATKSDGTSLSLLEAMASGCMPVISNIPSNRSWVLDGVNGFLFNNFSDFATIVEKNLKANRPEKMIDLNRKIIVENGLFETQKKKILNFLLN